MRSEVISLESQDLAEVPDRAMGWKVHSPGDEEKKLLDNRLNDSRNKIPT
jgi:hypothetical protein